MLNTVSICSVTQWGLEVIVFLRKGSVSHCQKHLRDSDSKLWSSIFWFALHQVFQSPVNEQLHQCCTALSLPITMGHCKATKARPVHLTSVSQGDKAQCRPVKSPPTNFISHYGMRHLMSPLSSCSQMSSHDNNLSSSETAAYSLPKSHLFAFF